MPKSTTRWAWKAVNVTMTTRNGFAWPLAGKVAASGPFNTDNTTPCPAVGGDGLCLAKTPAGAASGGYGLLSSVVLLVSFDPGDVLGEDEDKVRVKKCQTHGTLDARALCITPGADLGGANLSRANLGWADLNGANLHGANLNGANLHGANLSGANLNGADLDGADLNWATLGGANLDGANLHRANLRGADLRGANLRGATLSGANLSGANLRGADLSRADLRGAIGLEEAIR